MTTNTNTALVIVDVQGKLAQCMHNKSELFNNLSILVQGAKLLDIPILWVEQNPNKLGPTIDEIAIHLDAHTPISKMSFSCFQSETFSHQLKELDREHILVCGIESHICVYQTVTDLFQAEYLVEVVADAVSSRQAYQTELALDKLRHMGVPMTSVEMILFELMKSAEHPRFREVQALLK
ncbi:hydrolase [Thaumasiovibrio sp. DFM-14]|uniref:hydrolase n=1 Tax=Thaumasiovibrio sp. DFM-14 TaxID=3384792 RepID=UPI0039A0248B